MFYAERVLMGLDDEHFAASSDHEGPLTPQDMYIDVVRSAWGANVCRYAYHLGMDAREDAHLFWIAAEALEAPEPEGWEKVPT